MDFYAKNPNNLSGPTSPSFAQFTVKRNNQTGYGHAAAIGSICLASADPALPESLKKGLWYDATYALADSMFAPYLRPDSVNINTAFQMIVVTGLELASLSSFAEYIRKHIWHIVLKAALYVKYARGKEVAPYFSNNCPYDLRMAYKDSSIIEDDGLSSVIATPSVNICKELVDILSIALQFPDLVKTFDIFSNALLISTPATNDKSTTIQLPGSKTVTIISHIVSAVSEAIPPNICLSKSAFENIKARLSTGEFYGGLLVTTADAQNSLVIMNGLVFEVTNGKVAVTSDIRIAQSTSIFNSHLTNFEFSLVAAEARINFLLSRLTGSTDSTRNGILLMQRYLLWLGRIASSGVKNDTLTTLQARALYLAKIASDQQSEGVPIPLLTYRAHKDVITNVQNVLNTVKLSLMDIQNQIRARKAEERQIDRQEALNENIIKTGKLLVGYISAQASYQDSVSEMFEAVVKDTEKNVLNLMDRAKGLNARLNEQRKVVQDSIEKYKEAVAEWQKQETLKAALSIASSLFLLGFSFITPSGSITALAELGKTVQRVQKAVTIFDAVIKAYGSIQSIPNNPQSVIDVLNQNELDFPSELEWDEMSVNMEATLATGPGVPAKYALSAAFAILVLRGKALMQVEKEIQAKVTELSAGQNRILLHKQQQARLLQLREKFNVLPPNLDVDAVDLVGMTSQLTFFERQMLMIMASTIVIQDRALQYEYLRPPTPISSFSFMNLQVAIVSQSLSINLGLSVQPQPILQPNPIIYEIHGVLPSSLTNNNIFRFSIPLNKREFASYNYVRIANVRVEIGGILLSDSGQYYTELDFEGQPFFDRGFNGEPLTFQTTSRMYTSLNYVANSSHWIDEASIMAGCNVVIDQNIYMITPFSTWRISLPPTLTNQGIKFDTSSGLTVRLIFCIFAQLKEMPHTLRMQQVFRRRNRNAYMTLSSNVLANDSGAQLHEENAHNSDNASRATHISKADVLSKMAGKSVCAGWDVVLSMTAEQINKHLNDQFNDRVDNPTFVRETGNVEHKTTSSEGMVMKTVFNFEFKAPKLQFLLNNSNSAQVYFPIKSGCYEYSILVGDKWYSIEIASVTESCNYYVQGDLPLAILQGSVSHHLNIALKLNGGAFSSQGFQPGTSNPMMNVALTEYFTNLKDGYEIYNLGTLNTEDVTLLPALTPTSFKLNVVHTPSDRDLLQLFITTSGTSRTTTSLYTDEPIPSSNECSLIINSKIFFQSVLPKSIGNIVVLNGNGPVNNNDLWQAKAIKGSVTSSFPPEMIRAHSYAPPEGNGIYNYEDFIAVPGDTVSVDLTGMLFQYGDSGNNWYSKMSFEMKEKEYYFKYGSRSQFCGMFGCGSWSGISYKDHSLAVNVRMNANLEFIIEGTGQDQKVKLNNVESTNPMITGELQPPAGACECNDRDLQKAFLDKIQTGMTPQLKNMLNQPFPAVSLFALKNILFPAQNLLDMKEAYVPGDMVIFGNFTTTK